MDNFAAIAVAIMDALADADAAESEANGGEVALYVTSGLEEAGFQIVPCEKLESE
ncbi:hypothetical protein [Parafrankia discariae]|uniref:hypothetical protein n=1 Tax=Parafrankia discariae TaxID=365528 RepID=UPI0012B6AACA|nr:hypothetical protein [Parafrankia discariae]